MTNFLGLLILFAVVMSAKAYHRGEADQPEWTQHQTSPRVNLTGVFKVLDRKLQEVFSTPQNNQFLCLWCSSVVIFVRNVSTDKDFLDMLVKNNKKACHFWSPAGFEKYCEDYVNEIPNFILTFADEYLDPAKDCATVCRGQEPDQQHPTAINNLMKSDYEKFRK
ncbi:uncharacterized protein LOC110974110 [Acanthaster planci]|uniref:Uncharacterized protein LOC110974110 n=1 Tax=Acanthaster planci TaxID=133434 RepID=A0A8B7XM41_ACAPL|nr:uncharacterized protein LOC110974110 [Acanthaster planci]